MAPDVGSCFTARRYRGTPSQYLWHEHAEYELLYVHAGSGNRFVGDHHGCYSNGELVLVGPGLPHTWDSDSDGATDDLLVVHFAHQPLGAFIHSAPELKGVSALLQQSARGLLFPSLPPQAPVATALLVLPTLPESQRLLQFLHILRSLSTMTATRLASVAAASPKPAPAHAQANNQQHPQTDRITHHATHTGNTKRIDRVFAYVAERYAEPLNVGDVAKHFRMSKQGFCRFFRRATARTFIGYVNEVRIGKACMLLIDTDQSISEVCYRVGFNSLSHFNETFRKIKTTTPTRFRKLHAHDCQLPDA